MTFGSTPDRCRPRLGGFTLVELLIVVVVLGILAAMALPQLSDAVYQARVAKAIGDIKAMDQDIREFDFDNNRLPNDLSEVGRAGMLDPWGNPYTYSIYTGPGGAKKDRFNVPINDDYDLWSNGRDGRTNQALVSPAARDDIVRGNNGGFVGLASNY